MAQRNVRNSRINYGRRPAPAPKRGRQLPKPSTLKPLLPWVGGVIVLFMVWRIFAVDKVEITGNKALSTQTIMKDVEDSFSKHPFSRNLLTLGLDPLDKDLLQDQHLKSVTVSRRWPTTVQINVTERQFALIWKSGAQVYVVDGEGIAVQQGAGDEKLPTITDTTGLPVTVGQHVAPARFVAFAAAVAGELQPQTKLAVVDMSVPQSTSELYVKTSAGYIIKFDTTSGVEEQLASLKQVQSTLVKLHKTPTQYIDLRIPNKAYYL